MLPFALGKRATTAQAKKAAGYDLFQWQAFRLLSHKAAHNLVKQNPTYVTWRAVPCDMQAEIMDSNNVALAEQQVPKVPEDVFDWRMCKAVPDAARTWAVSKEKARLDAIQQPTGEGNEGPAPILSAQNSSV